MFKKLISILKKRTSMILISIIIVLMLIQVKVILLTQNSEQRLLFIRKVESGEQFSFSYIHSVSKTPITEVLEITDDNTFKVNEVQYIDQGGAGMPEYSWDDEVFEYREGKFILSNFSRIYPQINLTVQKKYKDKLLFNNETIELSNYIGDIGCVNLKASNVSLLRFILYKVKLQM